MRGYNESEILPLVRWARAKVPPALHQFMPLIRWRASAERVVPEAEVTRSAAQGICAGTMPATDDPARYYRVDGDYTLGVIDHLKPSANAATACGSTGEACSAVLGQRPRLRAAAQAQTTALLRIRGHVWLKEEGYAATGYIGGDQHACTGRLIRADHRRVEWCALSSCGCVLSLNSVTLRRWLMPAAIEARIPNAAGVSK